MSLFNMYIKLLFDGGIAEYEDDEEYAPTGCVSFLTIHQSKGMEFPVVFVDSLGNVPRKSYKDILNKTGCTAIRVIDDRNIQIIYGTTVGIIKESVRKQLKK